MNYVRDNLTKAPVVTNTREKFNVFVSKFITVYSYNEENDLRTSVFIITDLH